MVEIPDIYLVFARKSTSPRNVTRLAQSYPATSMAVTLLESYGPFDASPPTHRIHSPPPNQSTSESCDCPFYHQTDAIGRCIKHT